MTVVYRGPIDDSLGDRSGDATQTPAPKHHYLKDALTAFLSDQPVAVPRVNDGPGRAVEFPRRDQHQKSDVSYTKHIVPILKDNCVSCHHEGAIAPWSMSNHAMVRGWSKMMREVVMTRRMPPGPDRSPCRQTHRGCCRSDDRGTTTAGALDRRRCADRWRRGSALGVDVRRCQVQPGRAGYWCSRCPLKPFRRVESSTTVTFR